MAWEHILKANKPRRSLHSFFFSFFGEQIINSAFKSGRCLFQQRSCYIKKKKLDAWNNFVLAPVALGDGMTVPIIGVFLFLDPSNVSLGFQKVFFFSFLFC